jgi:hypothetical protein
MNEVAGQAKAGRGVRWSYLILVGVLGLIVGLGAAFLIGTTRPTVSIHTGVASSAEGAISIEADGWTYGVPLDGVAWIDKNNSRHYGGRPDCLPSTGATRPITFAAVEVTVEGSTWRPVVWVDCR